jgi:hypothetical protein
VPPNTRAFTRPIAASSWGTIWGTCFKSALDAHGRATAADGTLVPPLTNDEAVRLVMAWHRAAPSDFPLWGQYAATAYGWRADNSTMDLTPVQRDAMYPTQISKELWLTLQSVSADLDAASSGVVRLEFDRGFDDTAVQGQVAAELKADGAGQITYRLSKGGSVPPKPDPKKQSRPLWVSLAMIYVGYRVLKRVTGGPRYAG